MVHHSSATGEPAAFWTELALDLTDEVFVFGYILKRPCQSFCVASSAS
jgi:hypothetical protein